MKKLVTIMMVMLLVVGISGMAFADVVIGGDGDKNKLMNQHGTIVGGDLTDIDIVLENSLNGNNFGTQIGDVDLSNEINNHFDPTNINYFSPENIFKPTNTNINTAINTNTNKFDPTNIVHTDIDNNVKSNSISEADAFAKSSAEQDQKQKQNQNAVAINEGTKVSISNKTKVPVQGVAPSLPGQLEDAPTPEEKFLWNQLGVDVEELISIDWTLEKAKSISPGCFSFRNKKAIFLPGCKKAKSPLLKLALNKPCGSLEWIGESSISGNKGSTTLMSIGESIEQALLKGADIGVLVYGINTIHNGTSAGVGTTGVNSHESTAATGLVSLSSADLRKAGEPGAILVCYRYID